MTTCNAHGTHVRGDGRRRLSSEAYSARRFQFRVYLPDEPLACGSHFLDLGVEVGGDLGRDDLFLALPLIDQPRDAIADHHRRVAMRQDGVAIDSGAVPGNDLRVWTRTSDHRAETIDQTLQ